MFQILWHIIKHEIIRHNNYDKQKMNNLNKYNKIRDFENQVTVDSKMKFYERFKI